mmetsp:Transcript_40683/g.86569  ORF Transcript_40683/g.86569 Transcript_40683/m.86569 type:complete len:249 (+) Transcript_40683:512-1258(+)
MPPSCQACVVSSACKDEEASTGASEEAQAKTSRRLLPAVLSTTNSYVPAPWAAMARKKAHCHGGNVASWARALAPSSRCAAAWSQKGPSQGFSQRQPHSAAPLEMPPCGETLAGTPCGAPHEGRVIGASQAGWISRGPVATRANGCGVNTAVFTTETTQRPGEEAEWARTCSLKTTFSIVLARSGLEPPFPKRLTQPSPLHTTSKSRSCTRRPEELGGSVHPRTNCGCSAPAGAAAAVQLPSTRKQNL